MHANHGGHGPPYRKAYNPKFDQSSVLLAKPELGGKCVPKQELGNETIGTS
jgi:hypothetical protein